MKSYPTLGETILRLEREQQQLRRDLARYRKLIRRYEDRLKEQVQRGRHVSP
jgi:hypothetical protein